MAYALLGSSWADRVISWSFAAPGAGAGARPAVTGAPSDAAGLRMTQDALDQWASVSGLSFVQVPDDTGAYAPDLRIGFADFTRGGAEPRSVTLGMAYNEWIGDDFVPGSLAAIQDPALRPLDSDPEGAAVYRGTWTTPAQTLLHEVGHTLGLAHSDSADDVMYSWIGIENRVFSADDVAGIQALYGGPRMPEWVEGSAGLGGVGDGALQFASAGYLMANPDVAAAGQNPRLHYAEHGWREGRDPSADFDTAYYLRMNPDIRASGADPFDHYLVHGQAEGRMIAAAVVSPDARGFDAGYYYLANPDVARAGADAWTHYNSFGWREGRDPNGYFDGARYLARNPDVAAAGLDPLNHYMLHGAAEGRPMGNDFNGVAYLAANPDVAAAGLNPLMHFLEWGLLEGRSPQSEWLA
ncbi:matrixin family metalloprotease [Pseudoroseomonas globiformis]|uniref:Matrixin family metalloprotease n=1 Tax=Teichococcus globiformis TaxID=2307229 RepID=A0ABV7FXW0_9PROT